MLTLVLTPVLRTVLTPVLSFLSSDPVYIRSFLSLVSIYRHLILSCFSTAEFFSGRRLLISVMYDSIGDVRFVSYAVSSKVLELIPEMFFFYDFCCVLYSVP